MIALEEIRFNYKGSGALDIQSFDHQTRPQAPSKPISAPEWKKGKTSQPVAYAAKVLGTNNTVRIKARFSGGPPKDSLWVWAVDPETLKGCFSLKPSTWSGVLAHTEKKRVDFDHNGESDLIEFQVIHHLDRSGVGIYQTTWEWRSTKDDKKGPWTSFVTTHHRTYVIVNKPTSPWDGGLAGTPWIEALDVACDWAEGAKDEGMAARLITERLNGYQGISYTPGTMFRGISSFLLSSFLNYLKSRKSFTVNCSDCANVATILSNLLGCNLGTGRLEGLKNGVPDMDVHKIVLIGGNPNKDWKSPGMWTYHEVAWLNGIGENESLYDASLQLDEKPAVSGLQALLPSKIEWKKYHPLLVKGGTCKLGKGWSQISIW